MNQEDKTEGLTHKYNITHADGRPVNPENKYFVLRYNGDDEHAEASRAALEAYAQAIYFTNPLLSQDLIYIANQEARKAGQE